MPSGNLIRMQFFSARHAYNAHLSSGIDYSYCPDIVGGAGVGTLAFEKTSSFNASRLGLSLLVMLGILFFIFMGCAAFAPGVFAEPVMPGGIVSGWFAFAFGLIWTSVLATGFYVLVVNAAEDRQ